MEFEMLKVIRSRWVGQQYVFVCSYQRIFNISYQRSVK